MHASNEDDRNKIDNGKHFYCNVSNINQSGKDSLSGLIVP